MKKLVSMVVKIFMSLFGVRQVKDMELDQKLFISFCPSFCSDFFDAGLLVVLIVNIDILKYFIIPLF